jgi:hypothetical protein
VGSNPTFRTKIACGEFVLSEARLGQDESKDPISDHARTEDPSPEGGLERPVSASTFRSKIPEKICPERAP